jgi:hypothetical protein
MLMKMYAPLFYLMFINDLSKIITSDLPTRPHNSFDDLPSYSAPRAKNLRGELDRFLSTDPEQVQDVLVWWYERKHMYPGLSRMALDYLSIPGML